MPLMRAKNPALKEAKEFWGKTAFSGKGFIIKRVYRQKGLNEVFNRFTENAGSKERIEALTRLVERAAPSEERENAVRYVRRLVSDSQDSHLWDAIRGRLSIRHEVGTKLSDTIAKHEAAIGKTLYEHYILPQIQLEGAKAQIADYEKARSLAPRKGARATPDEMRKAFEGLLGRQIEKEGAKPVPKWVGESIGKRQAQVQAMTGYIMRNRPDLPPEKVREMVAALETDKATPEQMERMFASYLGRKIERGKPVKEATWVTDAAGRKRPASSLPGVHFGLVRETSPLPQEFIEKLKAHVAESKKAKPAEKIMMQRGKELVEFDDFYKRHGRKRAVPEELTSDEELKRIVEHPDYAGKRTKPTWSPEIEKRVREEFEKAKLKKAKK